MKPKILISRAVFPEVIECLEAHFDIERNAADTRLGEAVRMARLIDKQALMSSVSDPVTAGVIAAAPPRRGASNFAFSDNHIDLASLYKGWRDGDQYAGRARRHYRRSGLCPAPLQCPPPAGGGPLDTASNRGRPDRSKPVR